MALLVNRRNVPLCYWGQISSVRLIGGLGATWACDVGWIFLCSYQKGSVLVCPTTPVNEKLGSSGETAQSMLKCLREKENM